jgi:hypothetical protein
MVDDMMALIASFSGKLYGMRSKAKKEGLALIESIPELDEKHREGGQAIDFMEIY